MSFESFLKDNKIIKPSDLNTMSEESTINRETLYATFRHKISEFGKTEKDLMDLYCMYDETFSILSTSKGLAVNHEIIRDCGGIEVLQPLQVIPFVDKNTNTDFVLFKEPDNIHAQTAIKNAYKLKKYKKLICDTKLWNALWSLNIVPLEISSQAGMLSSDTGDDRESNKRDSAARKLYSRLISAGYLMRASDVHLIPCKKDCKVLMRIDGHYVVYNYIPKDVLNKICNFLKQDGGVSENNPNFPVDGKANIFIPAATKNIDLRFSIIRSKNGFDLNIRYLSDGLLTFEQLGMSPINIQKYKRILKMPQGLVVQVGPTGSGKTTTLYSGLNFIKDTLENIITIEDPVEITMDGITQIDVDSSRQSDKPLLTFPDAVKASLRHDPDVIVVGEMRDEKTAEEALRAATTGHLVLASLHTNDSISVFERLYHMKVDSYSLGEVLVAVMGQRLVRRLCPHCKEEYTFVVGEKESNFWKLPKNSKYKLYRPVGCEKCNNIGYSGRIAINEILEVDNGLRDLIQSRAMRSKIEEYLMQKTKDGKKRFISMYSDGMTKVIQGITSLEEMAAYAADTTSFKGDLE